MSKFSWEWNRDANGKGLTKAEDREYKFGGKKYVLQENPPPSLPISRFIKSNL